MVQLGPDKCCSQHHIRKNVRDATATPARICRLGLEMPSCIEWKGWTPGKEYPKTLALKNLTPMPIKLRLVLPTHLCFDMDFPRPIKLSGGMSLGVRVGWVGWGQLSQHRTVGSGLVDG